MTRTLFLLPLLLATPAFAQEAEAPAAPRLEVDPEVLNGDSLTVGAAAGYTPSYEGSDDYVLTVVPGIRGRVSGINFTLRGNRFSADLVPTKGGPGWDVQFGPIVSLNFNRSAAIVDPRVRLLPKRKTAIEVGGYVGIGKQGVITSEYDKLSINVAGVYDVSGTHSSYVITPTIDYGTPLSTTAYVGLNFSANYAGEGYADTYFSVDPAGAAASGLPVFAAHKGWKDWTISTVGVMSLTGDLTGGLQMMAGFSYRRMLNDAADSPVTSVAGSRDQLTGLLGLAYTF
ncbi:MAG: MipA/OmpV family protein [Sphingomonas sp.]